MIEVAELTKYFGPVPAIRGVSFNIDPGEIVGFLGPNGAGKSTTMRILTGFLPATSGTARVAGHEVHAEPLAVKRRVGYLPEHVPLYEAMLVGGFLLFIAEVKGVAKRERMAEVERVCERCGLTHMLSRPIGHLSKGYRQRVGLAQALVGNPEVLILDEPTIGLDPGQIVEIRDMIQALKGDHTVMLSTHILPEVQMVCDRVIMINQGRVVAEDTVQNLTAGGSGRSLEEMFIEVISKDGVEAEAT